MKALISINSYSPTAWRWRASTVRYGSRKIAELLRRWAGLGHQRQARREIGGSPQGNPRLAGYGWRTARAFGFMPEAARFARLPGAGT